jgi:hypothetical protein
MEKRTRPDRNSMGMVEEMILFMHNKKNATAYAAAFPFCEFITTRITVRL